MPTFQPPAGVLRLVDRLRNYGDVLISDDASACTSDRILGKLSEWPEVTVERHRVNRGLARGLNEGLEAAMASEIEWLFTADQDSLFTRNYVDELVKAAGNLKLSGVALGVLAAGTVRDASGTMQYPTVTCGGVAATHEVVMSGSLWSVSALKQAGGFDERLGSDAVDAAACLRLRELGYTVALEPSLSFEHRIGEAQQVRLLGRNIMVTHHSADRRKSMLRNRLSLFPREFRESPVHGIRSVRRVVLNLTLGNLRDHD